MLQTNLNNFFIITSVVVGLFAILLIWVYLWETSRGLKITEIQIYKNYVNCSFAFALVMLVILWITTQGLDSKLMICFLILTVGWIVTAIFSAIVKNSVEDKRAMREAILPCIFKVIIMVAVLWLVY